MGSSTCGLGEKHDGQTADGGDAPGCDLLCGSSRRRFKTAPSGCLHPSENPGLLPGKLWMRQWSLCFLFGRGSTEGLSPHERNCCISSLKSSSTIFIHVMLFLFCRG